MSNYSLAEFNQNKTIMDDLRSKRSHRNTKVRSSSQVESLVETSSIKRKSKMGRQQSFKAGRKSIIARTLSEIKVINMIKKVSKDDLILVNEDH